jgi:3-hydroxy-9,10-secoandrosta-1,3,5(10)-triene-9,17-dione monooxygenase reductase component
MATSNAADPSHFRTVLSHFATGVTIVTGMDDGAPVGFTCQSFSALSLDPPLIWIAPSLSSTSWPKIAGSGAFTVNVLAAEHEDLCRQFSTSGVDKFAGVDFTLGVTGAPRIAGALATVDCTIAQTTTAGDHFMVVGAVAALESRSGTPLLYFRGGFGQFAL